MPSLNNPVNTLTKPRLNGNDLIGYVIEDNDPEKRQRVRIRIPQLHRNVPDDKLPWAIQDTSQGVYNAGSGQGAVNVPIKGTKVYVRFDDNDPHNPRYGGSPTTDDVNKDNELLQEDYPYTRGAVDAAGNRTAVNIERETMDTVHKSGTARHIDANGTVSELIAGDWLVGVNGEVKIIAKGKITINGVEVRFNDGDIEVTSPTTRQRPSITDQSGKTGY